MPIARGMTALENSPNSNLKDRFNNGGPITPQRSSGPPPPSPAPVSDPRDHPYISQSATPTAREEQRTQVARTCVRW